MAIVIVGEPFRKFCKAGNTSRHSLYVFAKCDCGKVWDIRWHMREKTQSCGCLSQPKHGYWRTGVYNSWRSMKERCTNPSHKAWHRYGGRGIEVCERWMKFELFLKDMGNRPDGHTIDRIDCDKGYEPGNCRWVPEARQNCNKSNSRVVTLYGKTMCLADWHRIVKHESTYAQILGRLNRGWSEKESIFGKN